VRPRNSWDLRSCRQQPGESLREYIQRFSKQCTELPNITDLDVIGAFLVGTTCRDLVSKLGRKTPTTASELMDIATKFASGQEAVEASFRRTSNLRKDRRKTPPRRPSSVARRRRPGRRRQQNATPLTRISSLLPSTGILGSLPEGPTCSTRCSRSRAPITGVPLSTPLKSATCSGVTSTRPDPDRRWQGPRQQQEGGQEKEGEQRQAE
jgi:hypothetical protein